MPKPLVIVESPAKARTIAGFLGADFVVESSIGHIRDLPRNAREIPAAQKGESWSNLGVDVDHGFKPLYIVPSEKKEQVRKLKALLKDASELYLATDEDREGEAIAWHLLEALSPPQKVPVKRMVFHEITREAIHEAIANWRDIDRPMVDAQEARRILDRLYGWEVSPVLWKKVMPKLSAGRVQSVATRLVVERERARMAFRSGTWWDLQATLEAHGETFGAGLQSIDGTRVAQGRDFDAATGQPAQGVLLLDEVTARGLAERLADVPYLVASVESRDFTQKPSPPFITSTLQQEAGRKLRFTAQRAMSVAQRLYERGYITYMRTDSTNLSEQAVNAARAQIQQLYGPDYLPAQPRSYQKKVKNAQEAHEAIRPAGEVFRTPDQVRGQLDADEQRLYELVWMRTVACQMADARGRRVSARLEATSTSGELATFGASGRTIEFPGYLRAYVEGADDPDAELGDREVRLPPLAQGDSLPARAVTADGHETQPPARYTEASLVKELEARGIGRPSTYASVISTVQDRGYVWRKGTALVPSWTSFAVVNLLERHFDELVDYDFTARMEEDLDAISRGEQQIEPWLAKFYFGDGSSGLHAKVNEQLPEIDARELSTIPLGVDDAGHPVVLRVGKYGPYVQRGDQTGQVPADVAPDELTVAMAVDYIERQNAPDKVLGNDPDTGLPVIAKDGRYGPYVQLGERIEGSKARPKTGSLFKTMTLDRITLDDALQLLSLPRTVGEVEVEGDDGTTKTIPITAQNGRFGPYLSRGGESRSLEREEQLFTVTLDDALALFAQPKRGRGRREPTVLRELGEHPTTGKPLKILAGTYGPYVSDGDGGNASLPKGKAPEQVDLEEAVDLLAQRAAKGPSAKKPARRRK